ALGIGESELQHLRDGQPLGDDELGTLARLLHRIAAFSENQRHQWSQWEPPWESLQQRPELFRGAFCRLGGHVEQLSIAELPAALQDRFEFEQFYRVQIVADDSADRWTVYTRQIPEMWQAASEAG